MKFILALLFISTISLVNAESCLVSIKNNYKPQINPQIEKLLKSKGYQITSEDNADYLLYVDRQDLACLLGASAWESVTTTGMVTVSLDGKHGNPSAHLDKFERIGRSNEKKILDMVRELKPCESL